MTRQLLMLTTLVLILSPTTVAVKVLWLGDNGDRVFATAKTPLLEAGLFSAEHTNLLLQEALAKMDELSQVGYLLNPDMDNIDPIRKELERELQASLPPLENMASGLPLPVMPSSIPKISPVQHQPQQQSIPSAPQGTFHGNFPAPKKLVAGKCRFRLSVRNSETQPGDKVLVIGDHALLGSWQLPKATLLSTTKTEFPMWSTELDLDYGTKLEFKYVVQTANGEVHWEDASSLATRNRQALVPKGESGGSKCSFNNPGEEEIDEASLKIPLGYEAPVPTYSPPPVPTYTPPAPVFTPGPPGFEATVTLPFMAPAQTVQVKYKDPEPINWNIVTN
jgi:hypothetical protein